MIKANEFFCLLLCLLMLRCKDNNNTPELSTAKPIQKVEAKKLNFMGHWSDEGLKGKLIIEYAHEFAFKHQDIDVNFTFNNVLFNNRDSKSEDTFVLRQVRNPVPDWDIVYFANMQSYNGFLRDPNWEKKYLVDFSQFPEFCKNTKPELLTEEFKSNYGGTLPGIFLTSYTFSFWCNMDIAKKVGINVKQFNMTFDDFLGYLKAVNEYNRANKTNIYGIFELEGSGNLNTIALLMYFSEMGSLDEIKDGQFSMKKLLALEKTLRELEKMNLYKPFPTDVKSATWDESNEFILNDKCLFYFNASWMYNIWQKKNDAKLKNSIEPVEPPSFKPNIAAIGGYLCDWVVLKNSPNRDRAVKFLTEMSNPEVAEKWARYTKSPTGLKENLSGSSFGKDQFETYSREIYKKYGKAILDNNKTGYYLLGQKGQNCYLYLPDVIFGKIKAEEAISRIRANLRGLKLM